jgi:hypothetical protein
MPEAARRVRLNSERNHMGMGTSRYRWYFVEEATPDGWEQIDDVEASFYKRTVQGRLLRWAQKTGAVIER